MSTSSSFILLREDQDNKQFVEKNQQIYTFSHYDQPDLWGHKIEEKDIPTYIPYDKLKYINHFTKQIYDVILNFNFNSSFSVLIDLFNLSPYNKNSYKIISIYDAEKMLTAISYLLKRKYDQIFEQDVLNNQYINIFGNDLLFPPYYNFYHKDKIDQNDKTTFYILKRMKIILTTFISLTEEDEWNNIKYTLLYQVN